MKEFDLDPTKVAVSLKYTLNDDLPPIRIRNDSNVLSYIMLKDMEREPTKYPLIIDVTEAEDMASDICEAAIENVSHIYDNEIPVDYVADGREVEEGRVFCDKDILKLSLSLFAIQNMFEFMVERADKKEYVVRCSQERCSWICRASKWGKTELFKIRKIGSHTCASNVVLGSHRQLLATIVSSNIKYKYTSSCTIYTPNDICSDMLHTYRVYLNYSKAWRSREQTLKMITGDPTDSFGNIPRFFYMLQQNNPETVTNLEVDSHNHFKYCFMVLGALIRDWKHCRPVIVVDGRYLNDHYGGTLFIVCTQDTSNSVFVIAFGIGDNENDKSWIWFLENLKKAYGNKEGLYFVSDRHNSIKNAIEHVYPGTYHAIRAYTLEEFEYHMRQLDTMNQKISAYLAEVGPEKWSRIHMPENRYSTMTSNIVESVNAVTKIARNYPIVCLLESLRQTTQNWFCKHRDNAYGTFTKLTSKYENKIRKISIDLKNLRVFPSNQSVFSVSSDMTTFVVDIEKQTCICRMLQVDLLPCPHALAIIANTKRDQYTFCSYYYTRNAYLNAYEDSIYPVENPSEWTLLKEVLHEIILDPNQKRSCERPTEKRKRLSREGKPTVKCGRCGEHGHNRRRCSNLGPLS
ncbi:uncharacterized protein LOC111406634 [Olea europaea var. sylvestris]|uniref:uncharacterized protein LOC111406634 n=1 Tax=Olea europaea var. sylvestris TaxID=158386 RepID=UPI000C1CF3FB|nr:uncharacterized protein LOC111406634 [Olea europaea var. sylvestris]